METTASRVADLAPAIAKRSDEIEQARRVPADLLAALIGAGCFRMYVPAGLGGDEMALPDVLRVIEALSLSDGSAGWIVGQAALAQVVFAHFPERVVTELYAPGPDLLGAGALAPKGRARRDGGGWRVTGQWPFVTGCGHSRWIYLQALVVEPGGSPGGAGAQGAGLRMMLLPADEVRIVDTWHVAGLCGTASDDVRVTRAFCPEERSRPFPGPAPDSRSNLTRIPARDQGGLFVAAASLGIARGAIDAVTQLAADGKRPAFSARRLAESALFQDRLGEAHMAAEAARALLYREAEGLWGRAAAGAPATLAQQAAALGTVPMVVALATKAADAAYGLAGGSAIYATSPLQRRLRDMHVLTQHFAASRDFFAMAGALLAGEAAGGPLPERGASAARPSPGDHP